MHDWWLALAAAGLGKLVWVPQSTILYRQHGANTLGANPNDPRSQLAYLAKDPAQALSRSRKLLADTQRQAGAFVERYGDELTRREEVILRAYSRLKDQPVTVRKAFFLRNRMLRDNIIKNLPYFILA